MAWILVNVSPKITSHSAGWMARVYSSVRSWRILRSSTQQSVATRLIRRRTPARGGSAGSPGHPGGMGSAEAAGGAPGAADVTDASLLGIVVQRPAGVMTEHVVERGSLAQPGLELGRGAAGHEGPIVIRYAPGAMVLVRSGRCPPARPRRCCRARRPPRAPRARSGRRAAPRRRRRARAAPWPW